MPLGGARCGRVRSDSGGGITHIKQEIMMTVEYEVA